MPNNAHSNTDVHTSTVLLRNAAEQQAHLIQSVCGKVGSCTGFARADVHLHGHLRDEMHTCRE